MFCCLLASHDTLEVPQYHRGEYCICCVFGTCSLVDLLATTLWKYRSTRGGWGGSVFVMYLDVFGTCSAVDLLATTLWKYHSTTGGGGGGSVSVLYMEVT